jgi:biotin carboxylase
MKTVLVTGAGGSASHNFVECLRMAPHKYRIVGTDINPYHIQLTKLDAKYLVPYASDPNYLQRLEEIIVKEGVDFVHPQPDSEVLALAGKKLPATTYLPSKEVIGLCHDKSRTNRVLGEAGVPVPVSFQVQDERAAADVMRQLGSKMWLRAVNGAGSRAALPVTDAKEVAGWIDYWQKNKGIGYKDFMLSEYLPGDDFAWTSLWKDGQLIVSQGRKRIWYLYGFLSPAGISSTPSVAVTINRKDVNEIGTAAVLAVDKKPNGVYCVDMKCNDKGIPNVTEINAGRFFTTTNFYAYAGVNFPYAYLQAGLGFELPHYDIYDPIPAGAYWIRMVDSGYGLFWESELNI